MHLSLKCVGGKQKCAVAVMQGCLVYLCALPIQVEVEGLTAPMSVNGPPVTVKQAGRLAACSTLSCMAATTVCLPASQNGAC